MSGTIPITSPRASRIVARESELGRLSGLLERALAGECSVCFVAGEAGAGKTALLGEFARRAQERDPTLVVAIGDCNAQTGAGDPYLPFREVLGLLTGDVDAKLAQGRITEENAGRLRDFLKISGESLLESGPDLVGIFVPGGSLLARLGGKLARRVPWMDRLTDLVERRQLEQPLRAGGVEQSHIFEQYTNVLRALSQHRPLVLIVDDLHWSDAASTSLLFHLGRRLGASRVLLVGAYRPDDVALGRGGDRHPLDPVLNELKRYHGDVWIDLQQAQDQAGRAFIDALIDAQPNRYDEAFRAALFRHTQGHPLFAVELLRHLEQCGAIECDAQGNWCATQSLVWDALPPRVEGVIEERIARLDTDAREVLRVASVEGETFTAEVVAEVCGADGRGTVRRLGGDLEKQHRIVAARGQRRVGSQRISHYAFRHNLFQRYLYNALDESERAYLHEDVGRALQRLYGDNAPAVAVQLGHHFSEAGDAATAVKWLRQAGDGAQRNFANAEAIEHYRRALDLLDGVGDDEQRAAALQLHEALGDVLERTGSHEAAGAAYTRAFALAPEHQRVTRARMQRKRGKTWEARQTDEALAAFDAAEAVLGVPEAGDVASWHEWTQIQLDRAWAVYFSGAIDRLEELIARVQPVVEQYGTDVQKRTFIGTRVMARLRRERYRLSPDTLALAAQYCDGAIDSGDLHHALEGRFEHGFCLLWSGRPAEAAHELGRALILAERCGDLRRQTLVRTYLGFAARLRGLVEETQEHARCALDAAAAGSLEMYVGAARANLAWAALRIGDLDAAAGLADEALAAWNQVPGSNPLVAYALLPALATHLHHERLDAAVDCARGALNEWLQPLPPALDDAVRSAIAAFERGDPESCTAQLHRAVELGRAHGYT